MRISIVIALHENGTPEKHVQALAAQTAPASDFEVVLIDGWRSFDAGARVRAAIHAAGPRLRARFFELPKCGRAACWNFGLRETSAPLVLLLGDDFFATPRLVETHLALHAREAAATVCGLGPGVFPPGFEVTPFMRWLEDSGRLYGVSFTRPDPALLERFWFGANVSLKRQFLDTVGMFDEAYPFHTWDDYEMGRRLFAAGMRVIYLPEALADHEHRITMEERAQAMRESGASAVIFERTHSERPPWRRVTRRSATGHWAGEGYARLRSAVTGRVSHQWRWFDRAMDRAFAAGYRAAITRPDEPREGLVTK